MNYLRRKNGSSSVFLAVIVASLISIALTLTYAARSSAETSYGDGVMHLATDSLLGEYDYYVQRDYGLFLLQANDKELSRKLNSYAGYSLNMVKDLDFNAASVNAGRYSIVDPAPVRDQILAFMKSSGIKKLIPDSSDPSDQNAETDGTEGHTLRHGPTITSLPSRSLPDRSIVTAAENLAGNLKKPEVIFRSGTSKYLLDSYILGMFNSSGKTCSEDHFFRKEVEYIICGELSDEKNQKKVDMALAALRTGLNLSHIYSDPEKLAAISALAEVITPGILGTVTQAGIALVWAGTEAKNDIALLHHGHKVPIIKDQLSWAVDLDGLVEGIDPEKHYILPETDRGRSYADYLRVLLYIKDDNIKTARILDLIQINMRRNYDAEFLIQECAYGISVDSEINGNRLFYDKKY